MSRNKSLWISIEKLLLGGIDIPDLADAIDNHNLQTIDELGRRILATAGDVSDQHSKEFAKKHLALRYSLKVDPLPAIEQDTFEEQLMICGSPLDKFGWPEDSLPDIENINPQVNTQNSTPQNKTIKWTERPLADFEAEYIELGSYEKASKKHDVSRQRYSEVIKAKRKKSSWPNA